MSGVIKDAVLKGREGRAWLQANTPVPRSVVLPSLKTGPWVWLLGRRERSILCADGVGLPPLVYVALHIDILTCTRYTTTGKFVMLGHDKVGRSICYYRVRLGLLACHSIRIKSEPTLPPPPFIITLTTNHPPPSPHIYTQVKLHDPKAFQPEETLRAVIYNYQTMLAEARPDTDELCVIIDRTDAKSSNMVRGGGGGIFATHHRRPTVTVFPHI